MNENVVMDELILFDVTTDKTYRLRVDIDTAKRGREDPVFATELLQRYLDAHNEIDVQVSQTVLLQNECDNLLAQPASQPLSPNGTATQPPSQSLFTDTSSVASNNLTHWSHYETIELINAYDHFKEHFNNSKKRKHVWVNIQTFLESKGISKSEKAIENKWKNLLRTYKAIKDQNNKTGRGPIRFQFMDEMDTVLGNRPLISNLNAVGIGLGASEEATVSTITEVETRVESDNENLEKPCEDISGEGKKAVKHNNQKKRNIDENTPYLKRKLMKIKMEELDKKKKRQIYIDILREEKKKKEEREERMLLLKERELNIEERKIAVFEKVTVSTNSNASTSRSKNGLT